MTGLRAALWAETRKALASRVLAAAAVILVAGTAVLGAALTAAIEAGDAQLAAKLGPAAEARGWPLLTAISTQVTAAGALLAFGTALGWSFGREFTDGTVGGLFAVPVSRSALVAAKLAVHFAWCVLVALALAAATGLCGFAIGLGAMDAPAAAGLARLFALAALSGLVAVPAAWAATLGRGPLAGVATAIVLIVVAQVAVIASPEHGAWLPIAAPAYWAVRPDAVAPLALALVPLFAWGFAALTARSWRRLRLDR